MPMILDTYELGHYPSAFTIPRPDRVVASIPTLESALLYSWGLFTVGKVIELQWNYMPSMQFDALDAIYQDDEEVEWDPGIPGDDNTYNVEILDFTGDFHEAVGTGTEIWRQNCHMSLLIMSVNEGS